MNILQKLNDQFRSLTDEEIELKLEEKAARLEVLAAHKEREAEFRKRIADAEKRIRDVSPPSAFGNFSVPKITMPRLMFGLVAVIVIALLMAKAC